MSTTARRRFILTGAACAAISPFASAQTTQTIGPGAAVTSVDRFADFNALAVNGTPLSDYTESNLFVRTDGDSWIGTGSPVFDPFHGANGSDHYFYCPYGGSIGYTTIETTDSRLIYALEFMYGNGWTTGDPYGQYPWGSTGGIVDWQTWRGNTLISLGTIGISPILEMGTFVGFIDPTGFDRILIRCTHPNSGNPNLQVLALDNLAVQITTAACYANCDGSTAAPILNVNDFTCFLNKYAAGDPAANCDASTAAPILNVNDFTCFLNKYAAGCP